MHPHPSGSSRSNSTLSRKKQIVERQIRRVRDGAEEGDAEAVRGGEGVV